MILKRVLLASLTVLVAVTALESCGYDDTIREYLSRHFWLPFAKHTVPFERKNVRRVAVPFAGMSSSDSGTSLQALRRAYQPLATVEYDDDWPGRPPVSQQVAPYVEAAVRALNAAENDKSLTAGEKEEVALLAAKIQMRRGEANHDDEALLKGALQKMRAYVRSSSNPAYASEARGWMAHIQHLLGNQAAAGKSGGCRQDLSGRTQPQWFEPRPADSARFAAHHLWI